MINLATTNLTSSSLKDLPRSEKLEFLRLINAKLAREDIIEWILQNRIVNEKGVPIEFEQHQYLIDILRDMSRLFCCMKCSQVGVSIAAILKEFFVSHRRKLNCIHTLPTDDDVKAFASTKVNPIVQNNPAIKDMMIGDVDNVYRKQVGEAFLFWAGTKGQSKGIMITSDINVHDELDRSDLATVETYGSRLMHSLFKGEWVFSNPSRPKVGVDVPWQRSDKKQWHVRCSRCNERQPLDYFINVCKDRKAYICRKCREVLRPEDRLIGEWVPEFPGREWSGYHIGQLIAPWITADEIIRLEAEKSQKYFYNFILGLPIIGGANQVSKTIILECCTDQAAAGRWKILGVDVGKVLHCVQGTENGITRVFTLPGWDDLHAYIRAQGINLTVVDNAPENEEAAKLVRHFRGRAYRCIYDYKDKREAAYEFIDKGEDEGVVYAHRTRIIDHTINVYSTGEIYVYLRPNDLSLVGKQKPGVTDNCLCDHWETLYTVGSDGQDVNIVKKDRMGNVIRTWENSGPDHFAHANVYYELARQKKAPSTRMSEKIRRKQPDVPPVVSSITGY